jgi:hypothetical protein
MTTKKLFVIAAVVTLLVSFFLFAPNARVHASTREAGIPADVYQVSCHLRNNLVAIRWNGGADCYEGIYGLGIQIDSPTEVCGGEYSGYVSWYDVYNNTHITYFNPNGCYPFNNSALAIYLYIN